MKVYENSAAQFRKDVRAKRLVKIPENELRRVNYESASFLFDCFYSCDS